jgi:hypothetical protein
MNKSAAFWIDRDYDQEHASDGVSRYGAYVLDGRFELWTDDDQAVELAVFAWRRATSPVMVPGYVRRHPRICTAQLERSDWDGTLVAMVDLVIPQPEPLSWIRSEALGRQWQDWPGEWSFSTGRDTWYEPGTQDLARGPYLLATASLQFTVPSAGLAKVPERPSAPLLIAQCRDTVAALVRSLNAIVTPVINRIEEH